MTWTMTPKGRELIDTMTRMLGGQEKALQPVGTGDQDTGGEEAGRGRVRINDLVLQGYLNDSLTINDVICSIYNADTELTYAYLKFFLTEATASPMMGILDSPQHYWNLIHTEQLKVVKECIDSCIQPTRLTITTVDGAGVETTISKLGYFSDDRGDYLSAALNLANDLQFYMIDGYYKATYLAIWGYFDNLVTEAGNRAIMLGEVWGDWDDAAMEALSHFACDGVANIIWKLVKLMMALKYHDSEGS